MSSVKPPPAFQRPLPSASVVIATFGVQARTAAEAVPTLTVLADELRRSGGPQVSERARFVDRLGWENGVFVVSTARSFGHAMFRSLDLERWAEHHPTHLAIDHLFSRSRSGGAWASSSTSGTRSRSSSPSGPCSSI